MECSNSPSPGRGKPAAEPTRKIRVGVIGCGNVSGAYLPDLKSRYSQCSLPEGGNLELRRSRWGVPGNESQLGDISEPVFTLNAPARWDGREMIEVVLHGIGLAGLTDAKRGNDARDTAFGGSVPVALRDSCRGRIAGR